MVLSASAAPFDPFAPLEAAPQVPPPPPPSSGSFFANGNGSSSSPSRAAPPSFAPGATGLLGSNPFGAAAPAEFASAAPAVVVAAAPAVAAAPVVVVAAPAPAPAPAPPAAPPSAPPSASASADPFAGLGGLTLGPGPKLTPPLKAMAPDRGKPMSSIEKGGKGGVDTFDGF